MEHPSIIFKIVCPDRPGLVSLLTSWNFLEHPSIIFKIVCPDRPGLVSLLTSWISNYGGNIKHSDHHTDQDAGLFLSRIEWNSNNESFNRDEIYKEFEKIADEVNGQF